jgi:conjugative transfer region lipoprotein (TIGR03751 family)
MASTESFTLAACLAAAALLSACSVTGPRSSPLPQDGKTITEVYKEHTRSEGAGAGAAEPRERLQERDTSTRRAPESQGTQGDVAGGLRPAAYASQIQPMQQRFQRLPNPDLVMYVHPHLAKGRYPVPGYLTVFPMYETVEYALPGEVAPTRGVMADVPPMRNALGVEFDVAAEPPPAQKPAAAARPVARAGGDRDVAAAR